ncbi:hypothetical protein SESBI_07480 [Sesbania bispinosa]|nr:hypothetical protein SESBI_07480 [Sesbania bispinosa]
MALVTRVSNSFQSLKSLCSRRENWRLKLKLIRVWNMSIVATPNDPYAMKMLFLDEEATHYFFVIQGEKIEVVVQKQHVAQVC